MIDKDLARSALAADNAVERGFDRAAQSSKHVTEEFESALGALWEMTLGRGYPPFMQNLARANIEMAGFLGRRTRACLAFPAHLVRCQSPEGVLEEQLRFFKDAIEDYEVASGRVVQALRSATQEPVRNSAGARRSAHMQAGSDASRVKKQAPKRPRRRKSAKGARQGADT